MNENDRISIIIPTLNSANDLANLLLSMRLYNILTRAEVIVVDAGSSDQTIDVAKQYGVKTIQLGRVSKGKARNEGIKASSGNIIVNIDSDVDIVEGWFETILASMKHADIVAGFSPDPNNRQLPRIQIIVDGQDITYPTCNIAHRRDVFNKIGFFNETQNIAEDIDFNYRCVKAGYIISYNPRMKLFHYQRANWIDFMKQAFWNGEARYELNKLHPDLKYRHQHGASIKNVIRLGCGALGFFFGRYMKRKGEKYVAL